MRNHFVGGALVAVTLAACAEDPAAAPTPAGPEPLANPALGEWPTFKRDLAHTGVAPGTGAITAANHCIKWHPKLTCGETRGASGPLIAKIGNLPTVFFVVDGPKIGCSEGTPGRVFALEGQTGTVGWELELPAGAKSDPYAPTLADIDDDGLREIVFAANNGAQVFAVRTANEGADAGAGTIQWTFTFPERDARSEGAPIVANFDTRDAWPEVVVGTDYSRVTGATASKVFIIDGKTGLAKGKAFEAPSRSSLNPACSTNGNKIDSSSPTVADIDGLKLFVGAWNGKFYALEWRASPEPGLYEKWSDTLPASAGTCPIQKVRSGAAVAQLVPGGDPEVVFGYMAESPDAGQYETAMLRVLSARGLGLVAEFDVDAWKSTVSVADLDPTTAGLEIAGGRYRGIFGLRMDGTTLASAWDHGIGDGNGGWGGNRSSPAVADLDGDGDLEVVFGIEGSDSPKLVVVDGKSGEVAWDMDLPGSGTDSSPAIGDIDGDGKIEIVFLGRDGVAYAIDSVCAAE